MGNWEVDLSLIAPWLKEQDKETIIGVTVALNELRDVGPGLGRPLVDTVKGSSFKNMKELRPVSYTHLTIRATDITGETKPDIEPTDGAEALPAGDAASLQSA